MASLAELEEQLSALRILNKASVKTLDAFGDVSNAISERANRIVLDIKPWEVAQQNIALTMEEMSKAARCYHPPPSLPAVLSRQERDFTAVARCMEYLVYTDVYIRSHPPNRIAELIAEQTDAQLEQIARISEELIYEAFICAVGKKKNIAASRSQTSTHICAGVSGKIIKNPEALCGAELLIHHLGEHFGRTSVLQSQVKQLLLAKIRSAVEDEFDGTYQEEELGKRQQGSSVDVEPGMKHYQRGDHRLLGISKQARLLVEEVCAYIKTYILTPLEDDLAVAEMPADIATVIFNIIRHRADAAIRFDTSHLGDPTRMFILAKGQGIGMAPGRRYYQDIVFIGLDLIEELWSWKLLATSIPGDNNNFIDYVDNEIELFIRQVQELLEGFVRAQGALSKSLLKEYTVALHRTEWFPLVDCTVHDSTSNLLYFHKTLLSAYYGALKLALYGNSLTPSAEGESVKAVEDFLMRSMFGAIQGLSLIAGAAMELSKSSGDKGILRKTAIRPHFPIVSKSSRLRISPQVFLINNIVYLQHSYLREPCFSKRTMPTRETGEKRISGRAMEAKVSSTPIVAHMNMILEDEKQRYIDEFGESWVACFPDVIEDGVLREISRDSRQPLRKSQRAAVKRWHKDVTMALTAKLDECAAEAVMDSAVRQKLVDVSGTVVQEQFRLFYDLIQGRVWSGRPQTWMPYTPDEWVQQIRTVL